jgi:hypothetical protein
LVLDIRKVVETVSADVDRGPDTVADVKRIEFRFRADGIFHGHGFHEVGNSGGIDGRGMVLRVQGDDFARERILLLGRRFGAPAAAQSEGDQEKDCDAREGLQAVAYRAGMKNMSIMRDNR